MAHGSASLRFLVPILAPLPAAVKKKGIVKNSFSSKDKSPWSAGTRSMSSPKDASSGGACRPSLTQPALRFLVPILAPLPAAVKKKGPCKSLCAAPAKIALAFYLVKVYNVPNSKSEVLPMTPSNAHSFTAALGPGSW